MACALGGSLPYTSGSGIDALLLHPTIDIPATARDAAANKGASCFRMIYLKSEGTKIVRGDRVAGS